MYHVVLKTVLSSNEGVPPLVFLTYRTAVGALGLGAAALLASPRAGADALAAAVEEFEGADKGAYGKALRWLPSRPALLSFALLGLVGVALNTLCFTAGCALTSPAVAASVQPTVPVFTFVLALAMGLESVSPRRPGGRQKLLGMLCATLGAWVNAAWLGPEIVSAHHTDPAAAAAIASQAAVGGNAMYVRMLPAETQPFAHAVGVLSLLLNCVAIAAFLAMQERLPIKQYSPLAMTAWTFALGLLPVGWLAVLRAPDPASWMLSRRELIAVLYAGLGPSALNFFLLSYATRHSGAATTAAYLPLQPLASSTLQLLILGAPVRAGCAVGATLALAGVWLVTRGKQIASAAVGGGEAGGSRRERGLGFVKV